MTEKTYVGRFAPSPSGPLHLGSLVTALAGYLQARVHRGRWLLRIDDIDPPREQPGASQQIMTSLRAHGLNWDDDVVLQSQQHAHYDAALAFLDGQQLSYRCECTRKTIKQAGGVYPGTCRAKHLKDAHTAVRLLNRSERHGMSDELLGWVAIDPRIAGEDFIIHRKDGLYAYHLASVVDDLRMGITEIVRGADLLVPSACQSALFDALQGTMPRTVHVPVIASKPGFKLSKQNHARGLDDSMASDNLALALQLLNHPLPQDLRNAPVDDILDWACRHWQLNNVAKTQEIVDSSCT